MRAGSTGGQHRTSVDTAAFENVCEVEEVCSEFISCTVQQANTTAYHAGKPACSLS